MEYVLVLIEEGDVFRYAVFEDEGLGLLMRSSTNVILIPGLRKASSRRRLPVTELKI